MAGKAKTAETKNTAAKTPAMAPVPERKLGGEVFLVKSLPEGMTRKDLLNKTVIAVGGICTRLKQAALVFCKNEAELAALSASFWRLSSPQGVVLPASTLTARSAPVLEHFPEVRQAFALGAQRVVLVGWPETGLLQRLLQEHADTISLFTPRTN